MLTAVAVSLSGFSIPIGHQSAFRFSTLPMYWLAFPWAVVWGGDGVLHIFYQESDGDRQSAGISGQHGGRIFRGVSVPAVSAD